MDNGIVYLFTRNGMGEAPEELRKTLNAIERAKVGPVKQAAAQAVSAAATRSNSRLAE